MIKPTVYLDTSAINFLFADDAPEKKEITVDFFDNFVKTGVYETYISAFVIEELNRTKDEHKRNKLLNVLNDYPIRILDISNPEEVGILADLYTSNGILPKKNIVDATHVAICVIEQLNYLVSWNYKHLSNVNRERKILALNAIHGYLHPIRIVTPTDLIDYGT